MEPPENPAYDRAENGRHELEAIVPDAELIARCFHEAYERLAPDFGYRTREASAVPWHDVPRANKELMVAVVASLLEREVIRGAAGITGQ